MANPSKKTRLTKPQTSLKRRIVYSFLIYLTILLITETLCEVVLRYRFDPWTPGRREVHSRCAYDADLGWTNIPDLTVQDCYGPGQHLTHNSHGLRSLREYTQEIAPGKYRIICLGDSFTHGMCGDNETIPASMELLNPKIEAINMGTEGYGVDQAYLLYKRDGIRYESNMLLLAIIEDDLNRMLLPTFLIRTPKPLVTLRDGSLTLNNVPVPTWGRPSSNWFAEFPRKTALFQAFHHFYNVARNQHDVILVAQKIFEDLNRSSLAQNQKFVLVYLPTQWESPESATVRTRLAKYTEIHDIPFIDLSDAFVGHEMSQYFRSQDGHYCAKGNKFIADVLLTRLRTVAPDVP